MSELMQLIAEGEHVCQDFKFRIDDQKKITRTLCAFANTKGGRLLVGVKDNGKVSGCDPQEEFFMIEGAASSFCKPEIHFRSVVWQEEMKLVLEIDVPPSTNGPHRAKDDTGKWRSYVRVQDETLAANKITEGVWHERKNKTPRPETFSTDELALLKTIASMEPITLSKLYKKTNLPFKRVDRLLVLFIVWELVEQIIGKEGAKYVLSETGQSA
jgi:predicted HTH transcriptional regulator